LLLKKDWKVVVYNITRSLISRILSGDSTTCAPLQIQRQQSLQDLLIAPVGRPAVDGDDSSIVARAI
jgi:hypothetical protein